MKEKEKRTKLIAHDLPLRCVKVLNIICMTIPFACCWYGYYSKQMENSFYNKGNLLMVALFMMVYFLFARVRAPASETTARAAARPVSCDAPVLGLPLSPPLR